MKRLTATGLMFLLLVCGTFAIAATGGSASDPFISLSYINDTFVPSITKKAADKTDKDIGSLYSNAIARVSAITNVEKPDLNFTSNYLNQSLNEGGTLTLEEFSSFILLDGTANVQISSGEVIDLSRGASVPDGTVLEKNRKYFAAENTTATIRSYSALALGMVDGYYKAQISGTIPRELRFLDVPVSHWANEYVASLADKGIVNGVDDYLFAPNNTVTRAMFVTILGRLYGINTSSYQQTAFSDADISEWYGPYVAWAAQSEIVNGYGDGLFGPNDSITREQMAVIIVRYLSFIGKLPNLGDQVMLFEDSGDISEWAFDSVDLAQKIGLVTGKPGNIFDPRGTALRSEISAVTYRLIEHLS